jgi:hypothetical protein
VIGHGQTFPVDHHRRVGGGVRRAVGRTRNRRDARRWRECRRQLRVVGPGLVGRGASRGQPRERAASMASVPASRASRSRWPPAD